MNSTPKDFFETVAYGESEVPVLWQVRVIDGRYFCRMCDVSDELAGRYMHGEAKGHVLTRADFVDLGEPQEFADIESAHAWFATDWDLPAQSFADHLFSQIDPEEFTSGLVSMDEIKELLAARNKSLD